MKKIFSLFMVALMIGSFASCNNKADKSSKGEDSVATLFGEGMGSNLRYMVSQDSANAKKFKAEKFLEGLEQIVAKGDTTDASNSYLGGVQYGFQILQSIQQIEQETGMKIDRKKFLREFKKAFQSKQAITPELLQQKGMDLQNMLTRVANEKKANDPKAIENKKAGEAYASKMLQSDKQYKKTASGIVYKIIEPGSGDNFKEGQTVNVKYKGTHIDGKEFDQSAQPVPMHVSESSLIKGFVETLKLMKPGCKIHVIIPGELAYGPQGNQAIGPNETLVFDIEAVGAAEAPAEPAKK